MNIQAFLLLFFILCHPPGLYSTPESSLNWVELPSTTGIRFTPRNGKMWIVGGRTNVFTKYNLLDSYKVADVWSTESGGVWEQEEFLRGDYYAQQNDVVQPGPIAPCLNAVDINGDGESDIMVMAGGYASSPSNDVWVTEDGKEWIFAGNAPWFPRAWHFTTVFKGKLWLMGGTPLNSEVWYLNSATRQVNRTIPLTRSMYANYTYSLEWKQAPDAPWSPRVGSGLVSQWYFNVTANETVRDSAERMVLAGGYGGWLSGTSSAYDGYYCRQDSWQTYDGFNWTLLNWNNSFGGRAWFGMTVMHLKNATEEYRLPSQVSEKQQPPKMYIFGGGFIGSATTSKKQVNTMQGKADAYWSRDGATWVKINYEEGGGTSTVPFYSSQEWAKTIVDTDTKYLGLWGLTVLSFNTSTKEEYPGKLYLIAGDYTDAGDMSDKVYESSIGLFCDVNGAICMGQGECTVDGCQCIAEHITGTYCEVGGTYSKGATSKIKASSGVSYKALFQSSMLPLFASMATLVLVTLRQ